MLFCLLVGLPLTVALTPSQDFVAFGQHVAVGARAPDLSLSGPAQVVQVGNTTLDVDRVRVWGPLRPKLTLGPVQRNAGAEAAFDPERGPRLRAEAGDAVTRAFLTWYGWGALGLLAVTLAAAAGAAAVRTLAVLRRESRVGDAARPLPEIWSDCVGTAGRATAAALVASTVAWAAAGALAWAGTSDGLQGVGSLAQLVGVRQVSPEPAGPRVEGVTGAVIGDSRASRLGGPPLLGVDGVGGDADDAACGRSSDSLAAQLGRLRGTPVLNLACPGAGVSAGLLGPQQVGESTLPAQVGRLKQVRDLDFVVVTVGPNDVGWTDFLFYCYGVPVCADNLTQGEFDYRLAAFDARFGDLLAELNDLPGRPQVVVMTSYDAFAPDARCPDSRGPLQYPGLDEAKIELLAQRNAALNGILTAGARAYGFGVATPTLALLCRPDADGLGPDLQGLADPFPFHPTGVGTLRMAASVVPLLDPPRSG